VSVRPPGRDRRGLTLIELVLTLSILAIAGGLVAGAFTTSLRAWQASATRGREEFVARIVLERIAAQLRATVDTTVKKDEDEFAAFDAGEDHLRFVTLAAGPKYPVHVFYGLESTAGKRRLVYREYSWPEKKFFDDPRPLPGGESVPEITGLTVTATRREEKTIGTDPTPTEYSPPEEYLPAEVTIKIEVGAEGPSGPKSFEITVPIPSGEP
jgi:prepilin-type N-terminal cleavage/methylation domain-containing protein